LQLADTYLLVFYTSQRGSQASTITYPSQVPGEDTVGDKGVKLKAVETQIAPFPNLSILSKF
jgi:hypothetical protein